MNQESLTKFFDKLGICISGLCLIHCLIMPLILLTFPFISNYFNHDEGSIHMIFGLLVFVSALFAVFPNCRKSGRKDILVLAILGAVLVISAFTIAHHFNEIFELILTVIGSILLIIAHYKNMRVKHSRCEDKVEPCSNHH